MKSTQRVTKRLADVAEVVTGSTPSTFCPEYYGGEIPFVGPSDLGNTEPILTAPKTLTPVGAKQARVLPQGAVLVCCIGATIGKIGIAGRPLATNQQINALVFDERVIWPRYGFYFCMMLEPTIRGFGTSTTLPILPKSRFQELLISFPHMEEQRRIADILDKADAIRRKRKQAIALTDQLLRSTFLEMFGDPVTNPKGFSSAILADVAVFRSGDFLPARAMDKDGIYPVYGGNGITGFHGSYMFQEPMVVIGRVGVYCGATHLTKEKSWITDNALYIASMSPSLTKTYLYHALVKANLNQYASQSAQPLISGSRIGQIPMLIPPLPVQGRFEELVRRHDSLSMRQRQSEEYATQLFSALADRSFRGELTRTEPAGRQLSMFNK